MRLPKTTASPRSSPKSLSVTTRHELPEQTKLQFSRGLLEWMMNHNASRKWARPGNHIAVVGHGPLSYGAITAVLNKCEWTPAKVVEESQIDTVVIGRSGKIRESITELIEWRIGKRLAIYSQEMFLASLATGHNPFKVDPSTILSFAAGHPHLEWLCDLDNSSDSHKTYTGEKRPLAILNASGYHFGEEKNMSDSARQRALKNVISHSLLTPHYTSIFDQDYLVSLGRPNSAKRYRRIKSYLQWFKDGMKGRHEKSGHRVYLAVQHLSKDIDWLRKEFRFLEARYSWVQCLALSSLELKAHGRHTFSL